LYVFLRFLLIVGVDELFGDVEFDAT
jgi:hypothetical protein